MIMFLLREKLFIYHPDQIDSFLSKFGEQFIMPKKTFQDIATFFEHRGKSISSKARPFPKGKYIKSVKVLLGAGFRFNPEWVALKEPPHEKAYWNDCILTHETGFTISAHEVLKRLVKPTDAIKQVNPEDYTFVKTPTGWKITSKALSETHRDSPPEGTRREWNLEAKLALSEEDLHLMLNLLEAFVPYGCQGEKTVSLQADSHRAGDCWVGLTASYDEYRIPFIPISADIGCGMCMMPMLNVHNSTFGSLGYPGRPDAAVNPTPPDLESTKADGCPSPLNSGPTQLNINSMTESELELLKTKVGFRARKVLARGKVAEVGNVDWVAIEEALTFIGGGMPELIEWLDDFSSLLKDLEIPVPPTSKILFQNLSESQNRTLVYVLGFGMTLGSSGNHFLEMNHDSSGNLYLVIHSGSRGLGGLIYRKISAICTVIFGDSAVAVGWMADLYNRAYSVLNKFAVLNRLSCAIAMLKDLKLCCDGQQMRDYLVENNPLFSEIGAVSPDDISNLLRGVTHNGVNCFVNHSTQQKIFVMCKGAIAISSRSSCGIVALRAGEGVYVMTFLNSEAGWVEHDMGKLSEIEDYPVIYDLNQTDVLLMGHGAGRSGSATSTWKKSEYPQMMQYFMDRKIWASLSPNGLGDNPELAYKPVEQVICHLPLDQARSSDLLTTLVNHKEGIEYRPQFRSKFAQFVSEGWESFSTQQKLMCDLVLVTTELQKLQSREWLTSALEEQDRLFASLVEQD